MIEHAFHNRAVVALIQTCLSLRSLQSSAILRCAPHALCPGGAIRFLRLARATYSIRVQSTAWCSETLAHVV